MSSELEQAAAQDQAEHDEVVLQLVQDAMLARPQVVASREYQEALKDQALFQQAPPDAEDDGAEDGAEKVIGVFDTPPGAPALGHVQDRWKAGPAGSIGGAAAAMAAATAAAAQPGPGGEVTTFVRVKRKRDELPADVLYLENAQKPRAKRANMRDIVSGMRGASLAGGSAAGGGTLALRRVGAVEAGACRGADGGADALEGAGGGDGDGGDGGGGGGGDGGSAAAAAAAAAPSPRVIRKAKRPARRPVKAGEAGETPGSSKTAAATLAKSAQAREQAIARRRVRVVELGPVASAAGAAQAQAHARALAQAQAQAASSLGAGGGSSSGPASPATLIRGPSALDFVLPQAWVEGAAASFVRVLALVADGESVDFRCREGGRTALMAAAKHGNADAVRELLRRRADVAVADDRGAKALDHADIAARAGVPGAADVVEQLRQATMMKDALAMAAGSGGGGAAGAGGNRPTGAGEGHKADDDDDDDDDYVFDFYAVVAPSAEGGQCGKDAAAAVSTTMADAGEAQPAQSPSRQFVKMSQLFYLDGSSAAGDVLFDFGGDDEDDEDFGEDDYDSNAEDNPGNDYGDEDEEEAQYVDMRDGCSDDSEARSEDDGGDY